MSFVRSSFVLVETDPPQSPDVPFAVGVECPARQSDPSAGLRFRLTVANVGDGSARLANPYEAVTYQITDTEGWPVGTKPPPRAVRINGPRRPSTAKTAYLALVQADVDGRFIAVDEAIEADSFTLPAGSTLTLELRIDSVRSAHRSDTIGPPAVGEYHLSVLLPLVWFDDGEKHSAMVRSEDPLTITLLEPTDDE